MSRRLDLKRSLVAALVIVLSIATIARADLGSADRLTPTLRAPALETLRGQASAWLKDRHADAPTQSDALALWKGAAPGASQTELLDRLAATFALADPRAQALVELCSHARSATVLPKQDWLLSSDTPSFEANNLRLLYGRWLAHERLYDELLEQLSGLEPNQVVDPAALLFYQGVAHHQLLNKEEGLKAVDRLLSDVAEVPGRYKAVASLMRVDLEGLDDTTLDHIARRMDDIQRRLDLGRAGTKVCQIEDGVIKSLDKLIEDMEKQQQQQQQSGGGGSMQPATPMPDSKIAPLRGPGQVDKRNIGNTAGWGDLPEKQREEALQQIGKDFPAHYRDVIEQYFRKLASESNSR
jgi:hypothetical protein